MSWFPKKRIVVPIDFSDESFSALDAAAQMVESRDGLHVVHVLPELSPAEPMMAWEAFETAKRRKNAEEALRERLAKGNFHDVQLSVFVGDPGQEIAAYAERVGAELIVMPSHGRTGVRRLLIGSVAERVVRLAHCPVLVLRK